MFKLNFFLKTLIKIRDEEVEQAIRVGPVHLKLTRGLCTQLHLILVLLQWAVWKLSGRNGLQQGLLLW